MTRPRCPFVCAALMKPQPRSIGRDQWAVPWAGRGVASRGAGARACECCPGRAWSAARDQQTSTRAAARCRGRARAQPPACATAHSRMRGTRSGEAAPTSTIASAGTFARLAAAHDGVGRRRFVEAVGMALVGAEEREHPADALVGVDLVDQPDVVAGEVELLGELALDDKQGHVPTVPRGLRLGQPVPVGVGRRLGAVGAARSCAGCCGCGWRPCAR